MATPSDTRNKNSGSATAAAVPPSTPDASAASAGASSGVDAASTLRQAQDAASAAVRHAGWQWQTDLQQAMLAHVAQLAAATAEYQRAFHGTYADWVRHAANDMEVATAPTDDGKAAEDALARQDRLRQVRRSAEAAWHAEVRKLADARHRSWMELLDKRHQADSRYQAALAEVAQAGGVATWPAVGWSTGAMAMAGDEGGGLPWWQDLSGGGLLWGVG